MSGSFSLHMPHCSWSLLIFLEPFQTWIQRAASVQEQATFSDRHVALHQVTWYILVCSLFPPAWEATHDTWDSEAADWPLDLSSYYWTWDENQGVLTLTRLFLLDWLLYRATSIRRWPIPQSTGFMCLWEKWGFVFFLFLISASLRYHLHAIKC